MVVGVELAVRVVQRDADLHASILEGQHALDDAALGQPGGAVGPDLEQQLNLLGGQSAQRAGSVLAEHHHLALAGAGAVAGAHDGLRRGRAQAEAGKAVVEHRHVVLAARQLGGVFRIAGGGERIVFRRRQEGAIQAVGGVDDPLAAQRMPAHFRAGVHRLVAGTGHLGGQLDGLQTVKGQGAAIGLGEVLGVHLEGRGRVSVGHASPCGH